MSDYRDEVRHGVKEVGWTFWKVLPIGIVILMVVGGIGFGLNSLGLIGSTIVERKVFENSYQRSEALRSEIAQQRATIQVLEQQLVSANGEESVHINIQINAARIRLATVEGERL